MRGVKVSPVVTDLVPPLKLFIPNICFMNLTQINCCKLLLCPTIRNIFMDGSHPSFICCAAPGDAPLHQITMHHSARMCRSFKDIIEPQLPVPLMDISSNLMKIHALATWNIPTQPFLLLTYEARPIHTNHAGDFH